MAAPPWSDNTPYYGKTDTGDSILLPVSEYVKSLGFGFCSGMVVGPIYHSIKGVGNVIANVSNAKEIPSKLVTGVNATRANTLRTAGFCGVFSIVLNACYYGTYKFQDAKGDIDVWGDMFVGATAAAIMWAPRGLRSASRASVVFASIPLAQAALTYAEDRYYLNRASHCNSYSYPHFRHPQKHE